MTKKGTDFEIAVADIVRQIDPRAEVSQGTWVEGPDGRRELDVSIEANFEGESRKILIECKDYKKKIGIEFIDALHSKSHDLGFDFAILCCNRGFTAPAIQKAKRVGIGLVGILQKVDGEASYKIVDEVFTRVLQYKSLIVWFEDPHWPEISKVPPELITYEELPLSNWILEHALLVVASNPIVRGEVFHRVQFSQAQKFQTPLSKHTAMAFTYKLNITGSWRRHIVSMSATSGIYDWLRRRFIPAQGPGSFSIKDIDFSKGKKIKQPPAEELHPKDLRYGEFWMELFMFNNFPPPDGQAPDFSGKVINPDQLSTKIEGLSDWNMTSDFNV